MLFKPLDTVVLGRFSISLSLYRVCFGYTICDLSDRFQNQGVGRCLWGIWYKGEQYWRNCGYVDSEFGVEAVLDIWKQWTFLRLSFLFFNRFHISRRAGCSSSKSKSRSKNGSGKRKDAKNFRCMCISTGHCCQVTLWICTCNCYCHHCESHLVEQKCT